MPAKRKSSRPPLEVDVSLTDWGPRGACSADLDGRQILIDRGIPGERVTALVDRRRTPWRGVVETVHAAASDRTAAICPYYLDGCGGCQWQHVEYSAQVESKHRLVNREMEEAGVSARVTDVHAMDAPWRYRHTAAIAIGWEAGFRPRGRRGIVEIHDCAISHPLIGELAHRVNGLLRAGTIPNYHGTVWLACTVVGTRERPALQVLLQGIRGLTEETNPELGSMAYHLADLDSVAAVAYRHRSGEARALVGDLMSLAEVDGREMFVPVGAFFQANIAMVSRVLSRMREFIRPGRVGRAADIYGGIGTFGLPLASEVERVTLIEMDPQAVEAARLTAERWGLTNVDLVSRHAEKALPEIGNLDLVVVDPPRSGLGNTVVDALATLEVPLIFYVSCAPASLARDLAAFEARGYRVGSLDMYDFYPQTYHVESLTVLAR